MSELYYQAFWALSFLAGFVLYLIVAEAIVRYHKSIWTCIWLTGYVLLTLAVITGAAVRAIAYGLWVKWHRQWQEVL